MTGGSLFSGVGGLDLALEPCAVTPIWQVEVDSFCNSVLERHWPDVRRYTDIRAIDWASVERPDLVYGGFPCQPFSVAGQNRGADDERNMWPETYRAIRELGSRYVFLENVPGLLAHGYFGTILGELAEGGYDAVWDTFTAAEVGAPHKRERLFILAYAADLRCEDVQQVAREACGQEQGRREELAGRGGDVGHAEGERGASGAKPAIRGRQASVGLTGGSVADTQEQGYSPLLRSRGEQAQSGPADNLGDVALTESGTNRWSRLEWQDASFPPGPDDRAAWARVLAEVPALEPAVCRNASGISSWMDCLDWDQAHKLVLAYANASQAKPPEILHDLWDSHGAQGQGDWAPRRFPNIRSEEVLFSFLRQLAKDGEQGRTSLESEATSEGCLRSLWMDQIVTCPSCGWRPFSRRSPKHSDALRTLSRLLAQHAQAAWDSSAKSNALAGRTHRLKALGNAVCPAQGTLAFETLWRRCMTNSKEWKSAFTHCKGFSCEDRRGCKCGCQYCTALKPSETP